MKLKFIITAVAIAASTAAHGAIVYSQNFNSAANGTTGTGLGDGSNIVGAGYNPHVENWVGLNALLLTKDGVTGTTSNFFLPNLNPGPFGISSFVADFDVLFQKTTPGFADGLSFNFGTLNNTSSPYGSELGMYNPGNTGNVLSVGFVTYEGYTPKIVANYNGITVGSNTTYPPILSVQSSSPAALVHATISWDGGSGLTMTYGGNTVFSNLAIPGFTPEAGAQFAFAARTGAASEDAWIDNVQIQTVPEPSSLALVAAGCGAIALRRRRK